MKTILSLLSAAAVLTLASCATCPFGKKECSSCDKKEASCCSKDGGECCSH